MWTFILLTLLVSSDAYPTKEIENESNALEKPTDIEKTEKDVRTVSYIQNFKNIMADYVQKHYNNLTSSDMDAVKETLEEFLQNFAIDLHNVMVKGEKDVIEDINDGIPDATFDDVKQCIRSELAEINEETADLIVFKLRKNLMKTRNKLDEVITKSKDDA